MASISVILGLVREDVAIPFLFVGNRFFRRLKNHIIGWIFE